MTREEAIDYLDNYRKMYVDLAPEKFLEALDILLSESKLPENPDETMANNMTPDKIYIPQHNIEAGTIQELCELNVEGSVEYIRKDALLKWVRLAYGKLSMNSFDVQDVFEELIDKIK